MSPDNSPSVSVSPCPGGDPRCDVVWVRGDQDISTRVKLSMTISEASRLDEADIIVDLSGVTFMDASTIGVLVDARNRLRVPAHSLSVRDPSPLARRLLDMCGLTGLIDVDTWDRTLDPAS